MPPRSVPASPAASTSQLQILTVPPQNTLVGGSGFPIGQQLGAQVANNMNMNNVPQVSCVFNDAQLLFLFR